MFIKKKERGINVELRYSKGRMRIVYQGRILFRNIKFKWSDYIRTTYNSLQSD